MGTPIVVAIATAIIAALLYAVWQSEPVQRRLIAWRCGKLRELFGSERLALREQFMAAAAGSGKPRGLHWRTPDWTDEAVLARDRVNRLYVMLVPLALRFEAIEGGDMEDVEAVQFPKTATALFFFAAGRWHTHGKAAFNLDPAGVLERFAAQYERLV